MSSNEAHLLKVLGQVTLGVTIPGIILSGLLLLAWAALRLNAKSARYLNRVSLRLLCYALIADIMFALVVLIPITETNKACAFTAFIGVVTPVFSAAMFCCISVNLVLVLVFGFNGNKLEKYYVFCSLFVVLVVNVTTWASGELGWYDINGTCWFRGPPERAFRWLVATQSVWMVLMSFIEVVSVTCTFAYIFRNQARVEATPNTVLGGRSQIASTRVNVSQSFIARYRPIIIRIALYPILSCFLSITACFADVYTIKHTELTTYNMNIRILDMFVYTLRPLLYALLAATDPSFVRAVRSLRSKSAVGLATEVTQAGEVSMAPSLGPAVTEAEADKYELQESGKSISLMEDEDEEMRAEVFGRQI